MTATTETTQKDTVSTTNGPIAQNSAKAQAIINKATAKPKEISKTKTKQTTVKQPTVKKEKKPSLASKWDEIITKGGKWETIVEKAQAVTTEMGGKQKISTGLLRAHAAYRLKKDSKYLNGMVLTAEGISKPKTAKK